ncbi:hypothetical protein NC652_009314 [Populus alba x Populus x berolinensis]|nr:hypothetical protein NC652_009314 [Populus alba x Populus x berolinensis]
MVAMRNGAGASQRKERKSRDRKLSRSIKRIRADMVEISKGHKRITEGQEEVRERFEEISKEAAKLKEETNLISKQSAANQVRLDLMFQIVKARSENDTAMDAVLTQTLRIVQRPSDLEKAICSLVSIRNDLLIVGNHRNRKLQSVCPIGKEDPETLERGDKKKIRRGGGRAAEGRGGGQFNKG